VEKLAFGCPPSYLSRMDRMPAIFVGHGSPTNTFEDNRYTRAWRALGEALPRPRTILCVSAHWYFGTSAVTAMERPRTIHDFYGFPRHFYDYEYPAPGDPDIAAMVRETARPLWVGLDQDQWGLDHGTWSVLAHMFPKADVPVLQLSINGLRPLDYHLELGAQLAPLRDEGVLIMGSGNVVHNLSTMRRDLAELGHDWGIRFDDAAIAQLESDPGRALDLQNHPDFAMAVPTPEHFIPALYIAGLAAAEGAALKAWNRGHALGAVSMTSYALGLDQAQLAAIAQAGNEVALG